MGIVRRACVVLRHRFRDAELKPHIQTLNENLTVLVGDIGSKLNPPARVPALDLESNAVDLTVRGGFDDLQRRNRFVGKGDSIYALDQGNGLRVLACADVVLGNNLCDPQLTTNIQIRDGNLAVAVRNIGSSCPPTDAARLILLHCE